MMSGYRLNLESMMAFSVQRSSAGSEFAVHLTRSSGSERNSVRAMSGRSVMPAASRNFFHVANRACL